MKNLILLLFTTFTLSCCDKDEDEQLPPATQTGANTAGCLVNGQVFLPKGRSQFGPILSCFYQQDQDGYHFGLSINDTKDNNLLKIVQIATNPMQLSENTTYYLAEQTDNGLNYNSNFGEYILLSFNGNSDYITTTNVKGEMKVNKLDVQQQIISGTFWYDAINAQGEIVKIREGRFDMHYVN